MQFEGSRRTLIVAGSILVLLFSMGLARDLLLGKKTPPVDHEVPPMIVEGLDVLRNVEGDDWLIKADRVERRGEASEAETLNVTITSRGGTVWTIRSEQGTIYEGSGDVLLGPAVGSVEHSRGEFEWTAPRALWDPEASRWIFPEGFRGVDGKITVVGTRGSMAMNGALVVEEGAVLTWKEPAR